MAEETVAAAPAAEHPATVPAAPAVPTEAEEASVANALILRHTQVAKALRATAQALTDSPQHGPALIEQTAARINAIAAELVAPVKA